MKKYQKLIYSFLILSCLLSTLLVARQLIKNIEYEKSLSKQRESLLENEKKEIDDMVQIKELLASLDEKKVSLEDEKVIRDLRKALNKISYHKEDKLTLLKAEVQLETLYARNKEYRYEQGKMFTQEIREQLDGMLNEDMAVYIKMLDDGSTYMYNPAKNFQMKSIDVTMFATYLMQFELNQTAQDHIVYMMKTFDTATIDHLLHTYYEGNEIYTTYLDKIGILAPQTTVMTLWETGEMNVLDVGHTLCTLYECFETASSQEWSLQEAYAPITLDGATKYVSPHAGYHEMAVVYGSRPFILCVLTENEADEVIANIYQYLLELVNQ